MGTIFINNDLFPYLDERGVSAAAGVLFHAMGCHASRTGQWEAIPVSEVAGLREVEDLGGALAELERAAVIVVEGDVVRFMDGRRWFRPGDEECPTCGPLWFCDCPTAGSAT
jgi:hypothetical protein